MITKELIGEHIGISPLGVIEYKRIEALMEDGVELVRTNWRTTYDPLTDITQFPEGSRLRKVMEAVFTPTAKEAWREKLKEEENARESDVSSAPVSEANLAADPSNTEKS